MRKITIGRHKKVKPGYLSGVVKMNAAARKETANERAVTTRYVLTERVSIQSLRENASGQAICVRTNGCLTASS